MRKYFTVKDLIAIENYFSNRINSFFYNHRPTEFQKDMLVQNIQDELHGFCKSIDIDLPSSLMMYIQIDWKHVPHKVSLSWYFEED